MPSLSVVSVEYFRSGFERNNALKGQNLAGGLAID